ncbi:hypothetical protein ACEPPN_001536 [Leptodophora sp. 'Broadleaf-Isolate-01']
MDEGARAKENHRQAAELKMKNKENFMNLWLGGVDLGPDFKPDIRPRPKRQAFLDAEKDMVYRVHKNKNKRAKKAKGEEREVQMSFVEALFWAQVEPEYADFTQEFIEATAIPFEKRSAREHEVINIYWRLGYSLDPVLNFENSEVTQRQLESRMYGVVTWSGSKPSAAKRKIPPMEEDLDNQQRRQSQRWEPRYRYHQQKMPLSGSDC